MQCSSCQFENMPGTAVCGRCGTSLRLASAAIDVHPPRARPWVKRLRRVLPWRRELYRVRDAAEAARRRAAEAVGDRPLGMSLPALPVLLRLAVPGWAHRYCGQGGRGRWFLWAYLALLAPGLLFLGTGLGSVCLGLAFSVHASSALDLLVRNVGGSQERVVRSAGVIAFLAIGVYLPAGWLLTRLADPRPIVYPTKPFAEGDVVLANRWASPRPGRVVVYELRQVSGNDEDPGGRRLRHQGQRIDRVVAAAGDEVQWADGVLRVNGRPSRWLPLNPSRLPKELKVVVPHGHYLILPTTSPRVGPDTSERTWAALGIVPAENVDGVVYLRHQPLWRLGVIR